MVKFYAGSDPNVVFSNEVTKIGADTTSLSKDQSEFQTKIEAWKTEFREKVRNIS